MCKINHIDEHHFHENPYIQENHNYINSANKSLAEYLGIKRHTVYQFIKRRESFLSNFINIEIGKGYGYDSTKIFLTDQGERYIELIYYFRDYFNEL